MSIMIWLLDWTFLIQLVLVTSFVRMSYSLLKFCNWFFLLVLGCTAPKYLTNGKLNPVTMQYILFASRFKYMLHWFLDHLLRKEHPLSYTQQQQTLTDWKGEKNYEYCSLKSSYQKKKKTKTYEYSVHSKKKYINNDKKNCSVLAYERKSSYCTKILIVL